jgi:carbon storage regulator
MLVLSRKVGERVVIGEGVVLTVLEVDRRRIRLGIEAPANVAIWRKELSSSLEVEPSTSNPQKMVSRASGTQLKESVGDK